MIFLLLACESECLGDDCDSAPVIPWDPGDGDTAGDAYGSGDDTDTDDTTPIDTGRTVVSGRDCNVTVTTESSASAVQIAGEFNGWTPADMEESGGTWTADLGELDPGEYAYKFILDGAWEGDPPATVYSKWVDGSENRNLRVGDCQKPLLQAVSATASPEGTLRAEVQVALAADGALLDSVTATVGDVPVAAEWDPSTGEIVVETSGLAPGKHSVRVWATDASGRAAENEPLWIPLWVEDEPFEWTDGLMYFTFTDRFRNGDYGASDALYDPEPGVATCANWNGGDYLGIIDALEEGYFEALGVRTLWLSPVYDNPEGAYLGSDGTHDFTGYHGYWPISGTHLESRYGDVDAGADARLKELIATAHAHGIRVLFDLVMNHVHEEHEYVAEHPEWFGGGCVCGASGCDWDERARDCWFTDYLPDLDYRNHDIVERVTDDTLALLEAYDIDAVRVDAAKHMDHVAMRTLSMRLRDEVEAGGGADFYMVGETYTSDASLIMDYVGPTELDAQFDFPLYYAIRSAFVDDGSFYDLENTVSGLASVYGSAPMSPFVGNHDVERIATAISGQSGDCWSSWLEDPMAEGSDVDQWDLIRRQSMALAFAFTQPGVPLLYYGDEIGLHGGSDPDNRRPMNFDPYLSANQAELLSRAQAVGTARGASEGLRRGARTQLWVDDTLLVYSRGSGTDVAIVAMNKGSSRSQAVSVSGLDGVTLVDQANPSRSFTVSGGSLSLSLESWDYAILVPQ